MSTRRLLRRTRAAFAAAAVLSTVAAITRWKLGLDWTGQTILVALDLAAFLLATAAINRTGPRLTEYVRVDHLERRGQPIKFMVVDEAGDALYRPNIINTTSRPGDPSPRLLPHPRQTIIRTDQQGAHE